MSKIEKLAAKLCDEMMVEASSGNLENIKKTIAMLIEFSGYEVARNCNSDAAITLLKLAKCFEDAFPKNRPESNAVS